MDRRQEFDETERLVFNKFMQLIVRDGDFEPPRLCMDALEEFKSWYADEEE